MLNYIFQKSENTGNQGVYLQKDVHMAMKKKNCKEFLRLYIIKAEAGLIRVKTIQLWTLKLKTQSKNIVYANQFETKNILGIKWKW